MPEHKSFARWSSRGKSRAVRLSLTYTNLKPIFAPNMKVPLILLERLLINLKPVNRIAKFRRILKVFEKLTLC